VAGRKHLLSEDNSGSVRKLKADPAHIERQMRDERAAGRTPYVLDDDDMIRFGLLQQQVKRSK
jgi:hypothetical protein